MGKRTANSILYTHLIRWEPLGVPNSEGLAWIKTLAKDNETGARTALVKFDPGYKQPEGVGQGAADIFVLEGGMTSGKLTYVPSTYHYRPEGTEFGPIESPEGITRLIFQAGPDEPSSLEEVFIDDVSQQPWQPGYVQHTWKMRDGVKVLRQDKVANLSVLIHGHFQHGIVEPDTFSVHDHFEEAFILEGKNEAYLDEIDGHHSMEPGMYLWRARGSSGHGDVLNVQVPLQVLVRRGWVGDMEKFHEARAAESGGWQGLPQVTFRE